MQFRKEPDRFVKHFLSMPFIYMMIIPTVILDVFLEGYHHICFRLYGLRLVDRSQYIRIDRQKLQYLNLLEKAHCMYCGYVNGLYHYALTVASETEKYWCGIRHEAKGNFKETAQQKEFLPYNDSAAFEDFLDAPQEVDKPA